MTWNSIDPDTTRPEPVDKSRRFIHSETGEIRRTEDDDWPGVERDLFGRIVPGTLDPRWRHVDQDGVDLLTGRPVVPGSVHPHERTEDA